MNKIQGLLHTDKNWGKALFMILFYVTFFFFGYWVWFLLAKFGYINSDIFIDKLIPTFCFLILLPFLSFVFIYKIRKKLNLKINKIILFFIDLVLLFLNLILFIYESISFIKPNFF
jgi:hypothetical protein